MDTEYVSTAHVIFDPGALIAELDAMASSPTRSHTFVEAEKVRSLIYKHTKIVASSHVIHEEMAERVDSVTLAAEVQQMAIRGISDEIAKNLVLTQVSRPISYPSYKPYSVNRVFNG